MIDEILIFICFGVGSLASLVSLVSSRPEGASRSFIEFYFPALVCSIFGALLINEFKARGAHQKLRKPELWLWLGVFAVALVFRWKFAHQQAVFMDEDYQLDEALNRWPVEAGAEQHQPPFEFALQFLIAKIFGFSEAINRSSAMIFSSACVATLAVLGRRLWGGLILPIVAALVFTMHAIVAHYAWEARPISIGLAAAVLILSFFVRFSEREAKRDRREWLFGVAACSFALLSLGLQPAFFLAALFVVTMTMRNRTWRERFWFSSQILVALALFMPIQLFIFANAPARFAMNGAVSWDIFSRPFAIFVAPLVSTTLACTGLLLIFKKFEALRRPASFAALGFLFLIPLIVFFRTFIAYNLNDYYVVFFWMPWVICCFTLLREVVSTVRAHSTGALVLGTFVIVMAAWPLSDSSGVRNYLVYEPPRPDFRSAEKAALEKVGAKRAAFLNFCMASPDCSCEWGLTGSRSYLGGEEVTSIEYPPSHTSEWLPRFAHSNVDRDVVALFFTESQGAMCRSVAPKFFEMLSSHIPELSVQHFSGVDLVMLSGKAARRPSLLAFFEMLSKTLRSQNRSDWSLLPELIFLNEAAGNREKANAYFNDFVRISNYPIAQGNRAGIDSETVIAAARSLGLGSK